MLMQLVRSEWQATLAELEQVPLEDPLGRRLVGRVVVRLLCIYFSSRTPSLFLSFFLYSTLSFPLYFPGETIKFSGI